MKTDWADKLVAKKAARGNNTVTAQELRTQVDNQCEHNLHTWGASWTPEKIKVERLKETKRLIRLRLNDDEKEDLEYRYQQKGIEVQGCYNTKGKIGLVKLPFTDAEWGDLLNKEGESLPSCCANISRIREILQEACREDHYCEVEDLWEAATLAKGHDFKIGKDPIGKLIKLWEDIKDDARSRSTSDSSNLQDPKEALKLLYKCSGVIAWNDLFSRDSEERKFLNCANSERALATLVTCVHTLFYKFKELSVGPIFGYGVFNGKEIGETNSGIAIFKTQAMADEICAKWNKEEKSKKKKQIIYTVNYCSVSMTGGVEKII